MEYRKFTEEEIEQARNVSIHFLLGIPEGTRKMISSPFVNGDSNPSCCIYNDGSYHCYSQNKNGQNAIDFLMDMGYSFEESVKQLIALR